MLYRPASGELWLKGTQQPFRFAFVDLYSASGNLVEATSSHGLVAYPLDPMDMEWHRRELTLTAPPDYSDPFYIGAFASPGTPSSDLSAIYTYGSFGSGFSAEALPIQAIPEPSAMLLSSVGFGVALLIAGARTHRGPRASTCGNWC
jgi:hypothetical protein